MNEQLIYAINLGNLALGITAFGLLFHRTSRRRREYPREVYLLLVALEAFVMALLATSAELLILAAHERQVAHILFVSFVITVVKIGLLWVLWTTRHALYRTGSRHVEGEGLNADEMDVNHDFADHPKEGT